MTHGESAAMSAAQTIEQLAPSVRAGALLYLDVAGPTRSRDLTRVLCQHLETRNEQAVLAVLWEMVGEGLLTYSASALFSLFSLAPAPAGGDAREPQEQR
jgi:hypothetical protein